MNQMEWNGWNGPNWTKIDESGPEWTKMDPIDQSGTK